jgi:hypothetical protein
VPVSVKHFNIAGLNEGGELPKIILGMKISNINMQVGKKAKVMTDS